MTRTHDFTSNYWGHAIHTFYEEKDCGSWLSRLFDKWLDRRRYSVFVHTQRTPHIGDLVKYKTSKGLCYAKIYHVEPCRNPPDMFELWLVVDDNVEERPENESTVVERPTAIR